MTSPTRIYLDNAATTAVLPEVVAAMTQVMCSDFANPSSRHGMGLEAERHIRDARGIIAPRLGVAPGQLLFTSGGTEANALAILGTALGHRGRGHLLVSAIEHPSVLRTAHMLEERGVEVEELPVTAGGWVEPDQVGTRLRPETFMVAVMHVNNETGIRQPVEEISRVVKAHDPRCRLLVDAVQSFAVLPTDLEDLGADMVTTSGHKLHGPKGIGCLALRPKLRLTPLWGGGDQELGRRAGTENLPGIVGFARAVTLIPPDTGHLARLQQALTAAVTGQPHGARPLGDDARRAPHILTLLVPGVPSEVLVNALEQRGVFASSGSACHSRRSLRSHVLTAMQVPPEMGVLRLSLTSETTEGEILAAAGIINETVESLRPHGRLSDQ